MPQSESQKRANMKYQLKAYDRLSIIVKKGEKEKIKKFALSKGESLNSFVTKLIYERMKRES